MSNYITPAQLFAARQLFSSYNSPPQITPAQLFGSYNPPAQITPTQLFGSYHPPAQITPAQLFAPTSYNPRGQITPSLVRNMSSKSLLFLCLTKR
jgi:hypothetical protein